MSLVIVVDRLAPWVWLAESLKTKVQSVMSASVPPSHRVEENGSFVHQFGAGVGLATTAAIACTVPAMIRVSAGLAGSVPGVRAWAALVAASLGPMWLSLVALRGARHGLNVFREPGAGVRAFGLGLWLALLFVTLALYGSVLRATTHHHALAGVTYACGALAFAVAWGLVCARVVALLRDATAGTRRVAMVLLGAAVLVAVALLGVRFLRAVSQDESSAAADMVVDVLAFVFAAIVASRDWRAARRPLAILGPPVAVFVSALGITMLRDAPVHHAIVEHAPAFAPAAQLFSGR